MKRVPRRLEAVAAAALFVVLVFALAAHGDCPWPMAAIDARVHEAVQRLHTPALDALARAATWLGHPMAVAAATALAAALLAVAGRGREAVVLASCVAGTAVAIVELKEAFERARPLAAATLASFPSGHTALAALFYPCIARIATAARPRVERALALGLAFGLAACVGATRVYLGAHWLSDVLSGYALGCAAFSLFLALRAAWRAPRSGHPLRKAP